jgi:hypothetical protein
MATVLVSPNDFCGSVLHLVVSLFPAALLTLQTSLSDCATNFLGWDYDYGGEWIREEKWRCFSTGKARF